MSSDIQVKLVSKEKGKGKGKFFLKKKILVDNPLLIGLDNQLVRFTAWDRNKFNDIESNGKKGK